MNRIPTFTLSRIEAFCKMPLKTQGCRSEMQDSNEQLLKHRLQAHAAPSFEGQVSEVSKGTLHKCCWSSWKRSHFAVATCPTHTAVAVMRISHNPQTTCNESKALVQKFQATPISSAFVLIHISAADCEYLGMHQDVP